MKIPEDIGSKYRLIVLAGQRVAQLQKGAVPRVDSTNRKMTDIAIREVSEGRVKFHPREMKVVIKNTSADGVVESREDFASL